MLIVLMSVLCFDEEAFRCSEHLRVLKYIYVFCCVY